MRRFALAALMASAPAAALAQGTMPQMDFHNPLTSDQVFWMVVILAVLYFALANWALPGVGKVLANRAGVIQSDLAAARLAKNAADEAVAAERATLAQARQKGQAEMAELITATKAKAAANAAALAIRLDANLAEAEARIAQARKAALAALKPVAESATGAIILKLTGATPPDEAVSHHVEAALAAQQAG